MNKTCTKPIFRDINADDDDPEITEIESLCINCEENGVTRLMLTKIPFFKEVIISSFNCPHCNYENREIQSAGQITEKGVKYTLNVQKKTDFNRQIIRSDYASFSIPELEFEDVANKTGEITTLEGLINKVIDNLTSTQDERKLSQPEIAEKLNEFIKKFTELKELKKNFTVVLNDPSGNSFIENPFAPNKDENLSIHYYKRSNEQTESMGFLTTDENTEVSTTLRDDCPDDEQNDDLQNEVLSFPSTCPQCKMPCESNMKLVDIPMFKQVILMALSCDGCGYRDNEVKSGQGISDRGKKITLKLTDPSDTSRDILKSYTSSLKIPELDFELMDGTLGGKFTTIEGLLNDIKNQLSSWNPFTDGDSGNKETTAKMEAFCSKLQQIISGELLNIHIELDDPAGNCYIQNYYAPDDDPELKIEHYDRTPEQNSDLGVDGLTSDSITTNS